MAAADVGLVGLAVMGQNLVLNMERHGYSVAVYNRTQSRTEEFMRGAASSKRVIPAATVQEFVSLLAKPRQIVLMVQAGAAVDAMIDQLLPLLAPGDVIMDGGNSYYADTKRRQDAVAGSGVLYMGTGISGGEEGALHGPSIMPGGPKGAWHTMGQLLIDISAKVDGEPCCTYLGDGGVGHFVKMVHNGIEYGDMQLICEAYYVMRELLHLSAAEMSAIFAAWNQRELQSYLVEITAEILRVVDKDTGKPLVEMVLDEAGQKGTGKWTAKEALDLGIPAPTIAEAVFARYLSAQKGERAAAANILAGPEPSINSLGSFNLQVEDIEAALYAAKICSYAQGFALLTKAATEHNWELDLGRVAAIWRGGCIIRAQFLNRITEAYAKQSEVPNLLLDGYFRAAIADRQIGWRKVVALAAMHGLPVPGLASALSYYDAYRTERLPANLLQAQRDYFGAHTYKRIDRDGVYHTEWSCS